MLLCSESFRVSIYSRGSWYLSHKTYMVLWSALIKQPCKPAYTETLNSMNFKSLSTFAMVGDCS